ncbi:MAG: transposase, partial [Cellvibrionaceae bacterium]
MLDEAGKSAQSKSYMWLMACFDRHPVVAYHYSPSRSQDIPLGLLSDKTQALMIDGYNGYQPACERYAIERLGCWAHARRKFIDAQKALPKGKAGKADQAIAFIQARYRIEAKIKDEPPDRRRAIRQQEAKPIIENIKVWLDASVLHMLPSSKMGEALTYLQNQWSRLTAYLENGAYP